MIMTDEQITAYTPLKRSEATWVASWLKADKRKTVRSGWLGVYRMTPAEISKRYHVPVDEVLSAARGEQRR